MKAATWLLADATAADAVPATHPPLPRRVRSAIAPVRAAVPREVPDGLLVRGLFAWTHLLGAVSFELFGHSHNVVVDDDPGATAYFDHAMRLAADVVGLPR